MKLNRVGILIGCAVLVCSLPLGAQVPSTQATNGKEDLKQKIEQFHAIIERIRIAAEQGNVQEQYNLGVMYSEGKFCVRDIRQAVIWYRKAAEQGYVLAQHNLGMVYSNGEGVAKDDRQAAMWYRKAAEQGAVLSQFNLAVMYFDGEGVAKDTQQAAIWYRKAAEQGFAGAQCNLGVMYYEGQGVDQDGATAYMWANLAAAKGHENGARFRSFLHKQLTPAQIEKGQRMAREWLAQYEQRKVKK